ncbi:trimeric intracellular cation channel type B isoform X3 [Lepisosteus oculatus]
MLYCFGGAILSGVLLAEPTLAPFSNTNNVVLATVIWYFVFYCPQDVFYKCAAFLPLRLVLASMKEVTRTWKVLGGVTQARKHYNEGWFVMIAVGWAKVPLLDLDLPSPSDYDSAPGFARYVYLPPCDSCICIGSFTPLQSSVTGAGGGLMSNFEQLVRGVWKPETNELLKMSYPTKVTLIGAVLFTLQESQYFPLARHHLMFFYTIFVVINKVRMMLIHSTESPFAPLEAVLYHLFFARQPTVTEAKGAAKRNSTAACSDLKVKSAKSHNGSAVHDTNGNISCVHETNENSTDSNDNGDTVSIKTCNKKTD